MKTKLLIIVSTALLASCKDDPEPILPPVADFALPENGEQATAVSFQNQSKNATNYIWTFGDGSTAQDENPTHTYAATGTYSVKLKVSNGQKADSVTKTVTIGPYNIFNHAKLPFAGTYACKVILVETYPLSPAIRTRLPDQDIVVTKAGVGKIRWKDFVLDYYPNYLGSPPPPVGSSYPFWYFDGTSMPRVSATAAFFVSGDSAHFGETKAYGASASGPSLIYYGVRRP